MGWLDRRHGGRGSQASNHIPCHIIFFNTKVFSTINSDNSLTKENNRMIPFPNLIAGVLIGSVNSPWFSVAIASIGWSFIFCSYVWITGASEDRIEMFKQRGKRLLLGSPVLTFYAIEFTTALETSLIFASITFGVKKIFI
ncbi:MAG: hypothetical protein WC124_05370 [Desulfoplanes sp.]